MKIHSQLVKVSRVTTFKFGFQVKLSGVSPCNSQDARYIYFTKVDVHGRVKHRIQTPHRFVSSLKMTSVVVSGKFTHFTLF